MLLAVHYWVMEHLGSLESTQEARVALGYRLKQLLRFFRTLQTSRVLHLQVNALSEWIIGIYLHEFTNNEREISIPHSAALCGIENFEFIVSERVQLNPDNSRAMNVLTFLLFKLNTLQKEIVKLWVSRSHGVMTVVYWIYTTGITPW